MKLQLITPNPTFEKSYSEYIDELGNEEKYPYPMDFEHSDFSALLKKLDNYSKGIDLPNWLVPNSTFWLVLNNELIGVSHLRHYLNDFLREHGGHIGFGIRPGYRGKGYGKKLLQLTISKANKMGIDEVHLHCHKSNIFSARIIQAPSNTMPTRRPNIRRRIV